MRFNRVAVYGSTVVKFLRQDRWRWQRERVIRCNISKTPKGLPKRARSRQTRRDVMRLCRTAFTVDYTNYAVACNRAERPHKASALTQLWRLYILTKSLTYARFMRLVTDLRNMFFNINISRFYPRNRFESTRSPENRPTIHYGCRKQI